MDDRNWFSKEYLIKEISSVDGRGKDRKIFKLTKLLGISREQVLMMVEKEMVA